MHTQAAEKLLRLVAGDRRAFEHQRQILHGNAAEPGFAQIGAVELGDFQVRIGQTPAFKHGVSEVAARKISAGQV